MSSSDITHKRCTKAWKIGLLSRRLVRLNGKQHKSESKHLCIKSNDGIFGVWSFDSGNREDDVILRLRHSLSLRSLHWLNSLDLWEILRSWEKLRVLGEFVGWLLNSGVEWRRGWRVVLRGRVLHRVSQEWILSCGLRRRVHLRV